MAGIFGPSFADSYRYAKQQRDWLRDPDNPYADAIAANDNDWASSYDESLKAQQGNAVMGGILAGVNGLTSIVANANRAAQIADTSSYEGLLDDIAASGNYNYNNYNQLANDYARSAYLPRMSEDEIRGMSLGQKVGTVGSSALQGATTGFQIGGLWGGIAGLVGGAGIGLENVFEGDYQAAQKKNYLDNKALTSVELSNVNRAAAHERIGSNMHRQGAVNVVANGGSLKKQSITEFAESVLSNRNSRKERNAQRITRTKGEGGTIIRIRVK